MIFSVIGGSVAADASTTTLPGIPAQRKIVTPDRRLRVFVSSTLEELAEEREAVRAAVESMRLVPVMFEMGARPHAPRNLYRAYLEQSDVFLGIYWQRYGWVAPDEEVSGLEDEYRLSRGMPRLIYVKAPADEREPRLATLLGDIRDQDDTSYKRFTTPDQLGRLVADDLAVMLSEAFQTETMPPAPAPVVRSTLPVEPTPFVGRAAQVDDVLRLVESDRARLVTLTGPGGIGKSRLGLHVATRLQPTFTDGVFVAMLAEGRDPQQLPALIAVALGLRDIGPSSAIDVIKDRLFGRRVLLVLDNVEHMLERVDVIADLLSACADLVVLATSREPLHLQAEHEYRVPPMDAREDAVELFEQRVRAVRHDFAVTEDNEETVVDICQELDGVPLAIELAAARTRVLPVTALLERLQRRLEFLVGGARDLPGRQRTLRGTIDWSYQLLDDDEKLALARLAVFVGSFGLEAVDAVFGPDGVEALSMVTSLADKSLLQVHQGRSGETRFRMLSMIHDYACERLTESGEVDTVGARHADYYRRLSVAADRGLRGPQQRAWMRRLGPAYGGYGDVGNIRTALGWYIDHEQLEQVAEMAWACWLPAWMGGSLDEARLTIRRALAVKAPVSRRGRARMLTVLGMFSVWKGDEIDALPALTEALDLGRAEGDDEVVANARLMMCFVEAATGDVAAAYDGIAESLRLLEANGDLWGQATARVILGWMHVATEIHPNSPQEFEAALDVARRAGDELMVAMAEDNLAEHYLHTGGSDRVVPLLESALGRFRAVRSTYTAAYCIDGVARRAHLSGRNAEAARLLGATEAMREHIGAPIWSTAGPRHEALVQRIRAAVEPDVFAAAWQQGRRLRFDAAMDAALAELRATA